MQMKTLRKSMVGFHVSVLGIGFCSCIGNNVLIEATKLFSPSKLCRTFVCLLLESLLRYVIAKIFLVRICICNILKRYDVCMCASPFHMILYGSDARTYKFFCNLFILTRFVNVSIQMFSLLLKTKNVWRFPIAHVQNRNFEL